VPYGQISNDFGGFREMYAPGCFRGSLNKNLAMLFNHNPALVLGRTASGTAAFHDAPDGLWSACVPPDTQWAKDLVVSMQRGDIAEMSAAFYVTKSHWENRNGQKINVIDEGDLLECSVVTFAAYGDSTTAEVTDETNVDASFLAGIQA
jgi:HK97 family phage prohead protease